MLSSATDLPIPALSGELDLGMGVVSALGFYARGVRRTRRDAGAALAASWIELCSLSRSGGFAWCGGLCSVVRLRVLLLVCWFGSQTAGWGP